MHSLVLFAATCLLLLYIVSSVDIIMNFTKTSKMLKEKIKIHIPLLFCKLVIFLVILLKTLGSMTILYSIITKKYKKVAYYLILALILFNIAATLLFHITPFEREKTNMLKNVAITGGLILLLNEIK